MKMNAAMVNELQNSIQIVDEGDKNYEQAMDISQTLSEYKQKLTSENKETIVASMNVVKFFASKEKMEKFNLTEQTRQRIKFIQSQYNDGADWVGVCFAIYNGAAAVLAFLLMFLARITNRKITHMISLVVGGISLISIYYLSEPMQLIFPFIGIGLAWASILAMPYAILTGALPSNKLGVYMGIFNFFIVIPQILAATILGFITKTIFDGQAILALVLGGVTWFLAGALVLFVHDKR
jgi:MFS family permease